MDRMKKNPATGKFSKHETPNICTVEGCESRVSARGFCDKHYLRWKRHGDPNLRKKKANGEGERWNPYQKYTYIHVCPHCGVSLGRPKLLAEHRYIMEQHLGRKLLRSEVVHHIDGDTKNNLLSNLRLMNNSAHKIFHNTTSEPTSDYVTNRT